MGRTFKNEISDLKDELSESKKQVKDFQALLADNGEDGSSSSNGMLQQYMKENEALKSDLRKNERELKNAMLDLHAFEQNGGTMPKGKRRATIHTKSVMDLSNGGVDSGAMQKLQAELIASTEQMERYKQSYKTSEATLSLKTVEIRQLQKELIELRQAKELYETINDLAGDDEEESESANVADMVTKSKDGSSGKTTSRSNKSGNTTSRSGRRTSMSMKQQKVIADMIKSRDDAEQKAVKLKERVIILERTNKKLNKNIKSLNSEVDALKNSANQSEEMDASNHSSEDSSSHNKEKETASSIKPTPRRSPNMKANRGRRASCIPLTTQKGNGHLLTPNKSKLATERSMNSARSNAMYSPISEVPVADLSLEDLQRQIEKLR